MIRLADIHKSYLDGDDINHVLRGVTLEVEEGEFVALMGASGSGKSTLLNIVGGLDKDFDGQAVVAGQQLDRLDDRALSRYRNRTVSFVFQQFHLLPHLPVIHNVCMSSWFDPDRARADNQAKARQALGRVGLEHKARSSPNRLSGGEKQRVAIARAIFNSPKVMLCDEPTGALDTDNSELVMDVFSQLNRSDGITVLVVTHDPAVASRCQRVISIRDGVIVERDAPEQEDI